MGGVEAREADGGAQQRPHGLLGPLHVRLVVDADNHSLADGGRVAVAGDAEVTTGTPGAHVSEGQGAAHEVLHCRRKRTERVREGYDSFTEVTVAPFIQLLHV